LVETSTSTIETCIVIIIVIYIFYYFFIDIVIIFLLMLWFVVIKGVFDNRLLLLLLLGFLSLFNGFSGCTTKLMLVLLLIKGWLGNGLLARELKLFQHLNEQRLLS
jgi:hypothetical protein